MSDAKIELEVESREVVKVNLEGLKEQYAAEWQLTLDDNAGDVEEAEREFIIESYIAGAAGAFFEATVWGDVEYWITRG